MGKQKLKAAISSKTSPLKNRKPLPFPPLHKGTRPQKNKEVERFAKCHTQKPRLKILKKSFSISKREKNARPSEARINTNSNAPAE